MVPGMPWAPGDVSQLGGAWTLRPSAQRGRAHLHEDEKICAHAQHVEEGVPVEGGRRILAAGSAHDFQRFLGPPALRLAHIDCIRGWER